MESGFYYLQSRYYDPSTGRFINADDTSILQMTQDELLGGNLYAYCGNCPVNMVDNSGHLPKWITDFTRGFIDGFGNAARGLLNAFLQPLQTLKSILSLKNFISGWFSGLTIGWSILFKIVKGDFYNAGVLYGGHIFQAVVVLITYGVGSRVSSALKTTLNKLSLSKSVAQLITNAQRVGSALKSDIYHRAASWLSQAQLAKGKVFFINNGKRILLQVKGTLNGKTGIFEYIIDETGRVCHQLFKVGGVINGKPN